MVNSHTKHIRWGALLGMVILLIVLIVRCTGSRKYNFRYDTDSIIRIETVSLEDDMSEEDYLTTVDQLKNNSFISFDVASQIQGDGISDFINDFSNLKCRFDHYEPLIGITGKSFLINYEDGSWELINTHCSSLYEAKSNAVAIGCGNWYFNEDEFDALWDQYALLQK